MIFKRYIGYRCLSCGKYSGKALNNLYFEGMNNFQEINAIKRLHCSCKYCKKSFKFKKEGEAGTRIFYKFFDHPKDLNQWIARMNGEGKGTLSFYGV